MNFTLENAVFGEMSGSDIPQDHGLKARKYSLTHNIMSYIFQQIHNIFSSKRTVQKQG